MFSPCFSRIKLIALLRFAVFFVDGSKREICFGLEIGSMFLTEILMLRIGFSNAQKSSIIFIDEDVISSGK